MSPLRSMPQQSSESLSDQGPSAAIRVAIAATLGEMVIYGAGLIATFGVFLQPVSDALGWGRSVMSGGLLIGTLAAAASYPAIGAAVDRYGPRRILIVGQILYAFTIACFSQLSGSTVQLYSLYALLGVGFALSGQIAYSKAISAWFGKRRGIMLGITIGLGNAVGGALAPQLVRLLVDAAGWRYSYLSVGTAVLVLGVSTALFIRLPNHDFIPRAQKSPRPSGATGAFRRKEFWLLAAATVPGGLAAGAVIAHGIALMTDRGISREMATGAISILALMAIIGRVICGYLLDRTRSARIAIPFYTLVFAGLLMIDHGPGSILYLSAAIFGLGLAGEGTMLPYFVTRYFGIAGYGQVFGPLYGVVAITTGLGPLFMGAAYDKLGSYHPALLVMEALLAVAIGCVMFLGPYRYPARSDGIEREASE